MDECNKMGRVVKCPDVNESLLEFSVGSDENIRFGLSAIKGIGTAASESIIAERLANGKYLDLFDFIERVDLREVGKKTIENLVDAGAFDSLSGFNRTFFKYKLSENDQPFLDKWFSYGAMYKEEKSSTANSLFGGFEDTVDMITRPALPNYPNIEWSNIAILNREKELIGMYVSSHPLNDFRFLINKYATSSFKILEDADNNKEKNYAVAGIVESVQILTTKAGANWCRMVVNGDDGAYEFAIFGKDYDKFRNYYHVNNFLLISGKITQRFKNDVFKPQIHNISSLQEINEQIKGIELTIDINSINKESSTKLKDILLSHIGNKSVNIRIFDKDEKLIISTVSSSIKVETNSILLNSIEKLGISYKIT